MLGDQSSGGGEGGGGGGEEGEGEGASGYMQQQLTGVWLHWCVCVMQILETYIRAIGEHAFM